MKLRQVWKKMKTANVVIWRLISRGESREKYKSLARDSQSIHNSPSLFPLRKRANIEIRRRLKRWTICESQNKEVK